MTPSPLFLAWLHALASIAVAGAAFFQLLAVRNVREIARLNLKVTADCISILESQRALATAHADLIKAHGDVTQKQAEILAGARIIQTFNGGKHSGEPN